jgi:hypothetical protein
MKIDIVATWPNGRKLMKSISDPQMAAAPLGKEWSNMSKRSPPGSTIKVEIWVS